MKSLFENSKVHRYVYYFGLALILSSLPLSRYMQTVGLLILCVNWIAEGNYKVRFRKYLSNSVAVIISSLYLLHIIGLIYTTDFNYAFLDLRTKIPILILPIIMGSSESISPKVFRRLLIIFILATLASTLISTYVYIFNEVKDIRDICIFTSHIRLSLMISLAFFISVYYAVKENIFSNRQKIIFVIFSAWFIIFLFILESITGLAITFITGIVLLVRMAYRSPRRMIKIITSVLIVILPLLLFWYVWGVYKEVKTIPNDINAPLEKYTALGNPYFHDTSDVEMENGYYVWRYICESEMQDCWRKRSQMDYSGMDNKGQELKSTLRRFLTSKGFRKDAKGVNDLTDDEVGAIEDGISNIHYMGKQTIRDRIFETIWEYENYKMTQNPNEKSLVQRLEYWKASIGIISDHFIIGVGTGDMNRAFHDQYEKTHSQLEEKWRLRSHNQFLSITTGFGIVGLIWFLIVLFFPFTKKYIRIDFIYFAFFMIFFTSMISEDTIESQEGVYFYAFFVSFLLLCRASTDEQFKSEKPAHL